MDAVAATAASCSSAWAVAAMRFEAQTSSGCASLCRDASPRDQNANDKVKPWRCAETNGVRVILGGALFPGR